MLGLLRLSNIVIDKTMEKALSVHLVCESRQWDNMGNSHMKEVAVYPPEDL